MYKIAPKKTTMLINKVAKTSKKIVEKKTTIDMKLESEIIALEIFFRETEYFSRKKSLGMSFRKQSEFNWPSLVLAHLQRKSRNFFPFRE